MFKSIFSKIFTVMSATIIVSFLAMGGMQAIFSTRYWLSEKETLLKENAESVAAFTAGAAIQKTDIHNEVYYEINGSLTAPILQMLSGAIDGTALIVNNDYRVIACSEGISCVHQGRVLAPEVQAKLEAGESFTVSDVGGLYTTRQYTASRPIRTTNGDRLGYVLMSSSAESMGAYIRDNLQVFLLSGLGVLTVTFIVLYAVTYRMVRPLRQMAAAARRLWGRGFQPPHSGSGKGRGGGIGRRPQRHGGVPVLGGGNAPQLCGQCIP